VRTGDASVEGFAVYRNRFSTALVALLVGAAMVGALPSTSAAASVPPLPPCVYDDVLTARRAYTDWTRTLLDTRLKVGRYYAPKRLVSTHEAGIAGAGLVRPLVIDDLRALRLAARAAGNPIEVTSAYRSFAKQEWLFEYWADTDGMRKALVTSARPGHSEHQLGTALDFKSKHGRDPWLVDDWATSRAGAWMKKNGWKFGFVMSYPKGKRSVTCYSYEPWHYRYFGRDVARAIHESGLTARQWLWAKGFGV
jgi:D-alanyl-D-alanine carboxypeptidase